MINARTFTVSALVLIASSAAANGPIQISSRSPTVARISYDALEVHSAAGLSVLKRRIRLAAEEVCIDAQSDPTPMPPIHSYSGCYKSAVKSGMAQLHTIADQ